MQYDTIIIGSGAGGLSAAICLSRAGQKVLVLEQHDVPGGWCHSFYLNGSRFTPGVHYIGLLRKGESSNQLYNGLGIANDLVFFQMNKQGFEHCHVGDEKFDFPANFEELQEKLSVRFPKERKNIARYLKMVKTVSYQLQLIPKMEGFWDNITIPFRTKYLGKYGLFSLKRVIDWHIKDPLLKNILNIQCGDHGLPPGKASFPLHCAVMDHYFNGGFYPKGGGASIVKAMTKKIKSYDGEIRTQQKVDEILLEGNKAVGVKLKSGEEIFAKRVVSNADPTKTYLGMVGRDNISKKLAKKLEKTKYSCTSLMLFLTVDMDVKKAGLDSGNIWVIPNKDPDETFEKLMAKDISKGYSFEGFFVSCTTLKDPTSYDGKHHTLEVITYINHEAFDDFKNETDQRSDAYLAFKEVLTNKLINSLEKVLPGIKNHIVHKSLGTPLTNKHYINATNGAVYGTEKSLGHIGPFSFNAKSEIENLYLCGASILSHGVAGASYSGVQTAAEILNCKQDDLLVFDENQEIKIYDAESSENYSEVMLKKMKHRKKLVKNST